MGEGSCKAGVILGGKDMGMSKKPETWQWGMAAEGEEDALRRWSMDSNKFERSMLVAFEFFRMIVGNLLDSDSFRMELRYDAEAERVQLESFRLRHQSQRDEDGSGQESQGNQH